MSKSINVLPASTVALAIGCPQIPNSLVSLICSDLCTGLKSNCYRIEHQILSLTFKIFTTTELLNACCTLHTACILYVSYIANMLQTLRTKRDVATLETGIVRYEICANWTRRRESIRGILVAVRVSFIHSFILIQAARPIKQQTRAVT